MNIFLYLIRILIFSLPVIAVSFAASSIKKLKAASQENPAARKKLLRHSVIAVFIGILVTFAVIGGLIYICIVLKNYN